MAAVNTVREGIKYGIICGLIQIGISYISWSVSTETLVDATLWNNFFPFMIIVIIVGGLLARKKNGGYLDFKSGMQLAFSAYVIAALITAVSNYLLYNVFDKTLTERSFTIGLQKTRAMMAKMQAPQSAINETIEKAEKSKGDTGIKTIVLGMGLGLIWDFVKSLLITLVIRKEEKEIFE